MTQMLLFDSPNPKSTVVPVAGAVGAGLAGEAEQKNVAAELQHDSGLHRMGDLARLVLLRYELVAKRRERLAARRAPK